jgi:hypothetical protein
MGASIFAAISALMSAHEEWLKHRADAAKEPAK